MLEEKRQKQTAEGILEKEEKDQRLNELKSKKRHPTGIKRKFMRSEKPVLVRREVRREILSEDQVDIQKYLGLQLSEVEERKTRGQ